MGTPLATSHIRLQPGSQPVPGDYPNHLANPEPERKTYPRAAVLLAGLVLLCLALRGWMALRIPGVSPDSILYIQLAQALESGDLRGGTEDMSINTFPIILMVLHRLGMDWETAGVLWDLVVSSLVVLPLFGWVRRQFDDRVALVACLLYAVQPKMIAWSPEIMRDPTFWFLFILSIHLLWRAITEVRLRLFVLAGLAVSLASLTRFEGFFLYLPLALWTFWRWRALAAQRQTGMSAPPRKLVLGAAACVAVLPSLVIAANLAWLSAAAGGWVTPRLGPLERVQSWLVSTMQSRGREVESRESRVESPEPDFRVSTLDSPLSSHPSLARTLWVFFPTMTRGLSPAFALLMLGGLWRWRRLWARRDHQPLFFTALLIMAGIWVQYWCDRLICPRYALPIMLMGSPFAALGLLGVTAWLVRLGGRLRFSARWQAAAVLAPTAVVCLVGIGDAMTCNRNYFAMRRHAVLLGRWLRDHPADGARPAPPEMLVGPVGITQIVGYYAGGTDCRTYRLDNEDPSVVVAMVQQFRPNVLLLHPTHGMKEDRCAAVVERVAPLGLAPADPVQASHRPDPLRVLLRRPPAVRVARRPGRVAGPS